MSKFHKIRWQESDLLELSKTVKNFNAKITRLAKKNPDVAVALPEKVKIGDLKNLINTRQDLKREINALKRFSKRGAEQVVIADGTDEELKITKWQRTEMNRRVGIINRKRKSRLDEIQNLEMTSRGQALGYTRGQLGMGRATEVSLSPMNAFTRRMNRRDLKMKWQAILRESQSDYFTQKDFRLRENFIKALEQNFNSNDIQDVIGYINRMDIKDFLQKFEEEGGTMEFAYPPNREQYEAYVNGLKATWISNYDNSYSSNNNYTNDEHISVNTYSNDLSTLRDLEGFNGYIAIYSNGEKVGRFSSGQNALKYIKKNKLDNITFNLER